jgi:GT2 family glycosyltransferase
LVQGAHMGEDMQPTGSPTTSLIISTRNRPGLVWDVVRSVLDGEAVPTELVIVDQSDQPNRDLAQRPPETAAHVRYLWEPARGLSRGRNVGIAASTGQILVFVDDDVLVPATWFAAIVRVLMEAGPRAVVTGRVVSGEPEVPGAFAPSLILDDRPHVFRGRPGRDVLSMPMAMYRSAVDEVGDFDTRLGPGSRFPSSEDNDFGYRLLEAGYAIVFDPEVVVVHRAWREPDALLPLRWDYGRGQGAYFIKHVSRHDRYMWLRLARDVRRHLKRAPRRWARNPRDGVADVVYSVAVLAGAAQWSMLSRSQR